MDPCSSWMANGFVILLAPAICLIFAQYLQRRLCLQKLGQENGCEAAHRLSQKDRLLGIDTLFESYKTIRASKYLSLQQLRYAKSGNTYSFNSLGATVINTIDPENIQAMLAKQFNDFELGAARKAAFDPLIGHGIFTADGKAWQEARRLIRPCFTRNEIDDVSMFEDHVERLLHNIPRDSTPFDLQDLFSRLSIDVASKFLFGQSSHTLGGLQEPWYKISGTDFATAFNRAQHTIANSFSLGPLAFLVPKTQFRRDRKTVYDFVDQYIRKALSNQYHRRQHDEKAKAGGGHYQILHEYSKQTSDPEILRSGLLHVLLAGTDSTASLLSNLWLILAQHPRVWKRLQEEISTLDGGKPTFESLKGLRYLRHCINECMFSPFPKVKPHTDPDLSFPLFQPSGYTLSSP